MSVHSLAVKIVDASDKQIRDAIDSIRSDAIGSSSPISDSDWNKLKDLYIATVETALENVEISMNKAIINQISAILGALVMDPTPAFAALKAELDSL